MSEKQSPIQIKVSESFKRKFDVKCKENGKTITAVLKELMESYINDDGSEHDTLADADLQQLKDELYSLQCKMQSVEEEVQKNKDGVSLLRKRVLQLQTNKQSEADVNEQLQQHHKEMMRATTQYVNKQVNELKQMLLDTSNNNTSLSAQEEDNAGANNGKLS